MRKSGILMHISSLPSKYGIGTYGKEAYKFIDFLRKANQRYWQILPLGPTSYGDSPYQAFSAFANNPYFIDLDFLVDEGLLKKNEISHLKNDVYVDYEYLYQTRFDILKKAFSRFNHDNSEYKVFLEKQKFWLYDYAMFMTLKDMHGGSSWILWDEPYKLRDESALNKLKISGQSDINFWLFIQFKAFEQWHKLKKYANHNQVEIIGDMPIYVALDSSDVWTNHQMFQFDKEKKPICVAGVPPDSFSADGQLWGNPLYDWSYMKDNEYDWWIKRVRAATQDFDVIRIDHFIGFVNYYAVPYGDITAKNGQWHKGPGIDLFNVIKKELGHVRIIAEDLGVVTDEVRSVISQTGYPSMKLTQFAFDPSGLSDYLPHKYCKNTIVYTGTHDNETTKSWFKSLDRKTLNFCLSYINCGKGHDKLESLIKTTLASISDDCIIPIQDYLSLGNEARMNTPSTVGNNWRFRINQGSLTVKLAYHIKSLSSLYGRNV